MKSNQTVDVTFTLNHETSHLATINMFPRSLDDLLEVGCLHAHSIVVVGFGSRGQTSDEDHMADATTIVDAQNIYR